jgi:hypothetical protein
VPILFLGRGSRFGYVALVGLMSAHTVTLALGHFHDTGIERR